MRYADRVAEAEWQHGQAGRQPRRIWAVEALKPELTEDEYAAGQRAVRECILWFPGAKANMDRVDMAWTDGALAKQMDAGRALYGLRQGVTKRSQIQEAPFCAELIVQLYTLQEIAQAFAWTRSKGAGRADEPDMRRTKPTVRLVLMAMADYFTDCDRGADSWRGKPLDDGPERMEFEESCYSRARA